MPTAEPARPRRAAGVAPGVFRGPRLSSALRDAFASGYSLSDLRADAMAGAVVGVVALPLSMALAVASGVAPQLGLYTAIVAGLVAALLGGSRFQVSGPTAAFVVVLAPIASRFGPGGLLLAGAMAGLLMLGMAWARFGRLIQFMPYPVTMGFTSGIAVVIATLQVKDLLGLATGPLPDHYLPKLGSVLAALPTWRGADAGVGLLTLAVLLLWPRLDRRIPAPLAGLTAGAVAAYAAARLLPGAAAATVAGRFTYLANGVVRPGIPRALPSLGWPWSLPGAGGAPLHVGAELLYALLPAAFAIAMLGAIESLLSAVVADGMTGERHDPDGELLAIGVANVVAPFFGGIAATGAIARTATNIRSGARSPLAAATHALFVLAAMLALAPLLGHLPMASLAALLLVVAWNMGEAGHVVRLVRTAPRSDVAVLATCFLLTVVVDMTVSVTAGVVLAALLFIRRMAETSAVTLVGPGHHAVLAEPLPRGVVVYDVAGPLFFGAAQKAMQALRLVERRQTRVVVLDLADVPAIDATGQVALEALVSDLNRSGIKVVLAGLGRRPLRTLVRAGWRNRKGAVRLFRSFERGVAVARATVARPPDPADERP
jgi:SulP family sulfate permease